VLLLFQRSLGAPGGAVLLGKDNFMLRYHLLGVVVKIAIDLCSEFFLKLVLEAGLSLNCLLLGHEVGMARGIMAELTVDAGLL